MHTQRPCTLPVELWRKIFRFATEDSHGDDELLFHPETSPRQSLRTKLAIVQVSRQWRGVSHEFLWEYVGNRDQRELVELALLLRGERGHPERHRHTKGIQYGWWIRALHTRFNFGDSLEVFVASITSILQCCPNLNTFMHVHDYNGPLPTSVVTALASNCGSTLHRFQLDWGGVNIDDLLLLLSTSPDLQHLAVGCTFAPRPFTSGPSREFRFHRLRSLHFGNSEDGMTRRFNCHLLEAATWAIPALSTVSIDLDARTAIDEVTGFLHVHGPKLTSLSLTESGRVDGQPIRWNEIFTLCPNLVELRLSFNPFITPSAEAGNGNNTQPMLITSPVATHLKRLSFAQWEFFPGIDPSSSLPPLQRVLDLHFSAIGASLTPALQSLQFDFQTGKMDLPYACLDWWNEWVSTWRGRGLSVEGSNRRPLF